RRAPAPSPPVGRPRRPPRGACGVHPSFASQARGFVSRARAPEWRIGRGWSDEELRERLLALRDRSRNITRADDAFQSAEFRHYFSEARIARGRRGRPEPGGAFARAKVLVERYAFSDPRIVIAHFDPTAPLLGRRMLLEIQVHGLHYLCGVVV